MRVRPILRLARDLDLADRDRVFGALAGEIEGEIRQQRAPLPQLRLFADDAAWQVPLEQMTWPGFEGQTARLFRTLGAGIGVRRRFRIAMIHLPIAPDVHQGVSLAEVDMAGASLLSWRVGVLPVHQKGPAISAHPAWNVREGVGVGSLDPVTRRQLDPDAPGPRNPWPSGVESPIEGSFRASDDPPPHPEQLARALARDVLGDLLAGGRDELVAYVFRPGQTERWRIRRGLPVSVHEALRTLAGNDATGIVLVQPTLLEHGGTLRHAALFQAEIAGLRGGVSVPLEAPLDPVPLPTVRSGPDAWIGVPPTVTFEIAPAAGTVD